MSTNKKEQRRAKYREDLARQFSSRLHISLRRRKTDEDPSDWAATETNRIYTCLDKKEIFGPMNILTLARIIDTAERPSDTITHVLLPRKIHCGLESLNFLGFSGRNYLELLASCALAVAIFDFLRAQPKA